MLCDIFQHFLRQTGDWQGYVDVPCRLMTDCFQRAEAGKRRAACNMGYRLAFSSLYWVGIEVLYGRCR
jgi:hypothetical protein